MIRLLHHHPMCAPESNQAIPLLGGMAASFFGTITCCASLLVSMGLSLIIVALAWLWYRPIVTVALVAAACIPLFLSTKNRRRGPTLGNKSSNAGGGGGSGGGNGGYSYGGGGANRPEPSAPPAPGSGTSYSYSSGGAARSGSGGNGFGGGDGARARSSKPASNDDAPPAYSY